MPHRIFQEGDLITINMQEDQYASCTCNSCRAIRSGGHGIVTLVEPDAIHVQVINAAGERENHLDIAFAPDKINLLEKRRHTWEV